MLPRREERRQRDLTDLEKILQATELELAKRRLADFVPLAWKVIIPSEPFVDNWHIGCICEHLQALTELQIKSLVINCPPRVAKSSICSIFWFAWSWIHNPSDRWIFSSYNDRLVSRDAVKTRNLILSPWYREAFNIQWRLKDDQNEKTMYANTLGGERTGTTPSGVGGGLDANYVVTDDPHPLDAYKSPAELENTFEWWVSQMGSRGVNAGELRRLIVHQRIGRNDLSSRVMSEQHGYECLVLPMEAEPHRICFSLPEAKEKKIQDPIIMTKLQVARPELRDPRQEKGELLFAKRFDAAEVERSKREFKSRYWPFFQQRVVDDSEAIFKAEYFRQYVVGYHPSFPGRECFLLRMPFTSAIEVAAIPIDTCAFFQVADTAMEEKKKSDYTAIGTFALTPSSDLIVFDVFSAKLEIPFQYPLIKRIRLGPVAWMAEARRLESTGVWPGRILFTAIEKRASGAGLLQAMEADGIPGLPLEPGRSDKISRAAVAAVSYQNGKVYHPAGKAWVTELEDQLVNPAGGHDDIFDVIAYGAMLCTQNQILLKSLPNPNRPLVLGSPALEAISDSRCRLLTSVGEVEILFDDDD